MKKCCNTCELMRVRACPIVVKILDDDVSWHTSNFLCSQYLLATTRVVPDLTPATSRELLEELLRRNLEENKS